MNLLGILETAFEVEPLVPVKAVVEHLLAVIYQPMQS